MPVKIEVTVKDARKHAEPARSDLADKDADLDRQLAEGLGVVASLGGDLRRRDAEVTVLCNQMNIERRLSGDESDEACSGH